MKAERITLYSTRQCPHCRQVKAYFKQHKIPFAEFDIERNRRAFTDFQRIGGRGVPIITIGTHIINGFNPKPLTQALRRAGFDV
ncbi:MAG: glutaredoxin domain-containing protein [Sedimenticola sp.]